MADDKATFIAIVDLLYNILEFRKDYFGISLSLSDIVVGLIALGIAVYAVFRILD